ncbi:AP-3 complex subunit beta, partial [Linderina pennispora]
MAEYLSRAMAFAQDAAKLSLRLSEGLVENALEFGLDTPGSFYDNAEFKLSLVRQELSSASDKDKVTALKRLLAAIAKGHDVSEYFADVVKNVASGNLELRRLVYIYLLRYAEQEQDLALLSINTFQRDLTDQNQVIRAMALRVMSSIRVPVISSIVMLAVRKSAADGSPHVRKTAAFAARKLVRLDPGLREELTGVVSGMLGESSPLAVGAVIQAFQAVCPEKTELVHGQFRRWCGMVVDLDEWGQVELIKLLTRYARTQFEQPQDGKQQLDPDHMLLLRALQPLLQSRNSAVVLAAVSAHYHLAPARMLDALGKPLVRLLRSSREAGYVALSNILLVARRRPQAFKDHVRSFFIAAGDARFARRLKLQVLEALVSRDTVNTLVPELASYAKSPRADISIGAVGVIVACARAVRETSLDCFRSLLLMLDDARPAVADAAMQAVGVLLCDGTVRDAPARQGSATLYDILCFLARKLERLTGEVARATVFALVSRFLESR